MGMPNKEKKPRARRVNFEEFAKDVSNNLERYVPVAELNQLQDSLIARSIDDDRFNDATNLAILATSAQEMGKKGADSRGIGGNGYVGLSFDRMPEEYLGNTPKQRGKQIHYILEDLLTTHSDNWLDGGTGGPYIKNGKDGFNKFWKATDPTIATQILNKSYIRPRDREAAWNNRARVARNMARYMKKNGGNIMNRRSLEDGGLKWYDVVNKGDNLTKIADRNGITLKYLLHANPQISNPNIIQVGDTIDFIAPKYRYVIPEKINEQGHPQIEYYNSRFPNKTRKGYLFDDYDVVTTRFINPDDPRRNNPRYKDGGIYIKPSKRGTFTAAATKHGMGVQAFASKVLANKENYSPAMVKKANFARNASRWN